MSEIRKKLSQTRGVASLVVLLAAAVVVLATVIVFTSTKPFREDSKEFACEQAIDSATRVLTVQFLQGMWEDMSIQEAREYLIHGMPNRPQVCPAGGDVYLLKQSGGNYYLYCALHGKDPKLSANLNADSARDQVDKALERARALGEPVPDQIPTVVNGIQLPVTRTEEKVDIHRGTKTTPGYDGTVAFFMADGDGKLAWLAYADENNWVTFDYTESGEK